MTTPFPFQSGATLLASQLNAITELIINDKTDSYTLVAGDAGEYVVMNKATATTLTVPNNVFTAGQIVRIVNKGAGVCTVTAGAGTTVSSTGTLALAQYATGTLIALSASAFIFEAGGVTTTSGVVQVKSVTKTDAFSTTSTSYVDVTGFSISITPTSASNKILVLTGLAMSADGSGRMSAQLVRGATDIAISTGFATTNQTSAAFNNLYLSQYVSIAHLDSPATTSATTYKMQVKVASSTGYINSQSGATSHGNVSTLTVMEVLP